jgi:alpha-tubulin suppressor-like RCC1 family protein
MRFFCEDKGMKTARMLGMWIVAVGFVAVLVVGQARGAGSIVAWGDNGYGQCNVPSPNEGFASVAAGRDQSLGLKADESITAWGRNDSGECDVPSPNESLQSGPEGQRLYRGVGI